MEFDSDYSYDLTIILVTYNHENYISKALASIFAQKVDLKIQLLIADDASCDGTLDIIKQWETKDKRFEFNYLDNCKNLGISKNYQRAFSAAKGKYVAIIEGDDYWISPSKVATQADFLRDHWECDLCSVNYYVYDESNLTFNRRVDVYDGFSLISARDLINDNIVGNFSTCMYRRDALMALPAELFSMTSYDWIINICISRSSLIGFLHRPMSVYRLHQMGAWSGKKQNEKLQLQLSLIDNYNKFLNYIFNSEFELVSKRLQLQIQQVLETPILAIPCIKPTPKQRKTLIERLKRSAAKRFRPKKQ